MKRSLLLAGAGTTAVIVTAAAAVAFGNASDAPDAPTPLGVDTSQVKAILDQPGAEVSPALTRSATGALEEIDMTRAHPVLEDGANTVFIVSSNRGDDRVCLFAAREEAGGVWSAGTCDDLNDAGAGRMVVQLQDRAGGLDTPRTYYGLVPAAVTSVSASWGGSSEVANGVYRIPRASAAAGSGALTYEANGKAVQIPLG